MERLVGKKIIEVRQMTEEEVEYEGWPGAGEDTVLVLDDGTRVYASCDPEGNMPGALFVREPDKVVYRGNVYLALDEDDLCGSLEFIECAAVEAHKLLNTPEVAVSYTGRSDIGFETTNEAVARQYSHCFVEMIRPGADEDAEPEPTPWARENAALHALVKAVGKDAAKIIDESVKDKSETERVEAFETAAKELAAKTEARS